MPRKHYHHNHRHRLKVGETPEGALKISGAAVTDKEDSRLLRKRDSSNNSLSSSRSRGTSQEDSREEIVSGNSFYSEF